MEQNNIQRKELLDMDHINRSNNIQYHENTLTRSKYKFAKICSRYNFHTATKFKIGKNVLAHLFGNLDTNVIEFLKNKKIDVYGWKVPSGKTADPEVVNSCCTPLHRSLLRMSFCIFHGKTEELDGLEQCFKLLLESVGNLLMTDTTSACKILSHVFDPYSLYEKFCMNTVNILVMQVATYHALETAVEECNKVFPLTMPVGYDMQAVRDLYDKCREQLKILKSCEVCEIYRDKRKEKISMLTILAEDPRKIARFVGRKNKCIMSKFMNDYKEKILNHYYDTLQEHIKIIFKLSYCKYEAAHLISECSRLLDPHHLVVERIVNYLTFNDLLMFESYHTVWTRLNFNSTHQSFSFSEFYLDQCEEILTDTNNQNNLSNG